MKDYSNIKICIINGYPKPNREILKQAGVDSNEDLYERAFNQNFPGMKYDNLMIADLDVDPYAIDIESYHAFLWTGSNLTIYHTHEENVARQIKFCQTLYELGIPQWGSCWGVQMAAIAAGGEVQKNPSGREWFIARDIILTDAGKKHPFMKGKPTKFDGFIMHLDHVTRLPEGATLLSSNKHTFVQGLAVKYKKGEFWAQQYHPEYTLKAMARLLFCRGDNIVKEGHVPSKEHLLGMVRDLEEIVKDPKNMKLRDKWKVTDDVLSDEIRQAEIRNFMNYLVLPRIK